MWIPAFSGRRALVSWAPGGDRETYRDECAITYPADAVLVRSASARVGVTHIVIDPSLRQALAPDHMEQNPLVEKVFQTGDFEVYRLRP